MAEPTAYNLPPEVWREVAKSNCARIEEMKQHPELAASVLRFFCTAAWMRPEAMSG